MSFHGTVAPSTLRVQERSDGIAVTYLDGRVTVYRGSPERISGSLRTPPGKDVHVLITDRTVSEGIMVYVNDLKTHDEVLESSGVGRVIVESGTETEVFPGVDVTVEGHSVIVDADPSVAGGRVFVFAEDEFSEHAYEVVEDGRSNSAR